MIGRMGTVGDLLQASLVGRNEYMQMKSGWREPKPKAWMYAGLNKQEHMLSPFWGPQSEISMSGAVLPLCASEEGHSCLFNFWGLLVTSLPSSCGPSSILTGDLSHNHLSPPHSSPAQFWMLMSLMFLCPLPADHQPHPSVHGPISGCSLLLAPLIRCQFHLIMWPCPFGSWWSHLLAGLS